MEYWSEKCPYCGDKIQQSSLNNREGLGSPLIVCKRCKKTYIHPRRIEIGVLTEKERERYMLKRVFSAIWIAFVIAAVIFAITQIAVPQIGWLPVATGAIAFILLMWKAWHASKTAIEQELPKSIARLSDPDYCQILEKSGYKPKW